MTSLLGARRYLEAARRAGVLCAVVYESVSTRPTLRQAGLEPLIDVVVDAAVIDAEGLRSRPAPDLPLAACRRLELAPDRVVTFTSSPSGIVAGCRAGMSTIAVGADALRETFEGFGAEQVIPSLSALLDPRLRTGLDGGENRE